MTEKKEDKVHRIFITDTIALADSVKLSTIKSALLATGSLSLYDQYYNEAMRTVQRASQAGSMSLNDVAEITAALDKWRGLSADYSAQIIDWTKKDDARELDSVKAEIDKQIPEKLQMIEELHEKLVGSKPWGKYRSLFDLPARKTEDTVFFKDKAQAQ